MSLEEYAMLWKAKETPFPVIEIYVRMEATSSHSSVNEEPKSSTESEVRVGWV